MDIGTTLSRAFAITIQHRSLWILGFLASLLASASSSLNLPINLPTSTGTLPFLDGLEGNPQLLSALITVLCLLIGLGIALAVIGVIAQGALITSVGQIEDQGVTSLGQAWSAAARRFWALLGLRIVLALPVLGLIVLAIVLFGGSLLPVVLAAARGEQSLDDLLGDVGASLLLLLCSGCVMICVGGIYSILASALQTFGDRAILLENLGVISGLQRGWEVFRSNLFNIILLALVMLVISFVVSLITSLILTLIALPTTIAGLVTSLSEEGAQSSTLVLIVLVFIVAALIGALISALVTTFTSAVWTLAYRQIVDTLRRTQELVALPSA
jgi:hypothetical protein